MTALIDHIKNRQSVACLSDTPVDPALIRQILDAAICSPVHYQTDPWRFLVIAGEKRADLGNYMAACKARTLDDPDRAENVRLLDKIRKKPFRAPVIIVAGAAPPCWKKALMVENIASVSAACQNILLAASSLNLGAIWRSGSMMYDPKMAEFLGFEPETSLVGFLYIGHPVPGNLPKIRKKADAFTRWDF